MHTTSSNHIYSNEKALIKANEITVDPHTDRGQCHATFLSISWALGEEAMEFKALEDERCEDLLCCDVEDTTFLRLRLAFKSD